MSPLDPSSKARLNRRALVHFEGDTLFDRIARAVCAAECLPRKELYEAWEVARRVRRRFRGGRIVDLAAGHGLLAQLMLILDDSSEAAIAVDIRIPKNAARLRDALADAWPRLRGRVDLVERRLEDVPLERGDVVVCVHGCGTVTDQVLELARRARARVAVLPCCHDLAASGRSDLEGWLEGSLAMDVTRAMLMKEAGYAIYTQQIPKTITPKNRLLLGSPKSG